MTPLLFFLNACNCAWFADEKPQTNDLSEDEIAMMAPPDVSGAPADAQKTASGLAYKVLEPGKGGDSPVNEDTVVLQYTGWTTDGKMFFSTHKKGKEKTVKLKQMLPGLAEGVKLMTVGERVRLWVPEKLANDGKPGKPAGMLVYDVELEKIVPGPRPVPAPEDVAEPPADATRTASGVAYKYLTHGTGTEHVGAAQAAIVNSTGWTKDGTMFDTTQDDGRTKTFVVAQVTPGLAEALQLMVVGDKMRFWVPSNLAYGDSPKPGVPAGQLTFDIELLEIKTAPRMPSAKTQ
jgi:peptidylprolyl isomerase